MDLYTLDENFLRRDVVDDFYSVIWTERYSKAGDVNLIVPLTRENITNLTEGTFLAASGTDEVMLIESALIEENRLKLTGPSLLKFLDERVIRTTANHEDRYWNWTERPNVVMGFIVNDMCIQGPYVSSSAYGIDGPREIISNLQVISTINSTGETSYPFAIPFGPVYTALVQIADTYSIGQTMYLDHATEDTYYLLYKTYKGRDLTSSGIRSASSAYPIVRFSPAVDSLTDLKELRSIAGYKNVAYAFAPSNPGGLATQPGVAYADAEASTSVNFRRRVLMVFADDISTDKIGGSAAILLQMLNQRAKDALANNNYTKVVDGEVVPQNQYVYGKDYGLGDIVELQSPSGLLTKARITEYIRSQDATGERAYPTISVID